ncbi:heavy-metal-associated domain-containing protein [Sphingomonas tabacisoli]|uniref:Heavy-metal-associated domain-containing protein n=1 Tax=Sphingomonas tabacisoli TaxID=2249466 RepID=A0ABW4I375_9SPHN
MIALRRFSVPVPFVLLFALALGVAAMLRAQIEGGERGVPPIDSSSSFEVSGIDVDVYAANPNGARLEGWRQAQRKGWDALWGRTHGGEKGPQLSDSALDGIVAGVVVEDEQIGPHRYIARLGVLFDRARAGTILGTSENMLRSAPMLIIPVQFSGGVPQAFETRTEWQKAWARFRTGNSPVDYVRPTGTGPDSLILTPSQTWRTGRTWWRLLIDGYGAADVLVPQVQIERQWPGGPVIGRFQAFHGPDRQLLGGFVLRVDSADGLPKLMDEGVKRMDALFTRALQEGRLTPDPSLIAEPAVPEEDLEATDDTIPEETAAVESDTPTAGVTSFNVQFDTPDVGSVSAGEAALRGIPGVRSAQTASLALGGVSVMRVTYEGELADLAAALQARGWQVQQGAGTLRIRRGAAPAPSPSGTAAPK